MLTIDSLVEHILEPLALFFLIQAFVGCGSGLSDANAARANVAARAEARIMELCAPDAGPCDPARVRALSEMAYCVNAGMVASVGRTPTDAGGEVSCLPQ